MRTDIWCPTSSDNVRINNVIGGEWSRSAVDEERNLTRHVGGTVGKVLTSGITKNVGLRRVRQDA